MPVDLLLLGTVFAAMPVLLLVAWLRDRFRP